jgi:hypothetical protein
VQFDDPEGARVEVGITTSGRSVGERVGVAVAVGVMVGVPVAARVGVEVSGVVGEAVKVANRVRVDRGVFFSVVGEST